MCVSPLQAYLFFSLHIRGTQPAHNLLTVLPDVYKRQLLHAVQPVPGTAGGVIDRFAAVVGVAGLPALAHPVFVPVALAINRVPEGNGTFFLTVAPSTKSIALLWAAWQKRRTNI